MSFHPKLAKQILLFTFLFSHHLTLSDTSLSLMRDIAVFSARDDYRKKSSAEKWRVVIKGKRRMKEFYGGSKYETRGLLQVFLKNRVLGKWHFPSIHSFKKCIPCLPCARHCLCLNKKLTRFQLSNQTSKREFNIHGGNKRGHRCSGNCNVDLGLKLKLSLCHS